MDYQAIYRAQLLRSIFVQCFRNRHMGFSVIAGLSCSDTRGIISYKQYKIF